LEVVSCSDLSFVNCVDSRKSSLGYISFYWWIYPRDAVCRL
jgi:hypothetical protein